MSLIHNYKAVVIVSSCRSCKHGSREFEAVRRAFK